MNDNYGVNKKKIKRKSENRITCNDSFTFFNFDDALYCLFFASFDFDDDKYTISLEILRLLFKEVRVTLVKILTLNDNLGFPEYGKD